MNKSNFTTPQLVIMQNLVVNAHPMNFASMIEEKVFEAVGLTPKDFIAGYNLQLKEDLIRYYGTKEINTLLIKEYPELINELSSSVSVTAGMAIIKILKTVDLDSKTLVQIAEKTPLISVYKELASIDSPELNDWFCSKDIEVLDKEVLLVLAKRNLKPINIKIAECKTDSIDSKILSEVAKNCSFNLHSIILSNPHSTPSIIHSIKKKENL